VKDVLVDYNIAVLEGVFMEGLHMNFLTRDNYAFFVDDSEVNEPFPN